MRDDTYKGQGLQQNTIDDGGSNLKSRNPLSSFMNGTVSVRHDSPSKYKMLSLKEMPSPQKEMMMQMSTPESN